jgi:hypothetical protein
MRNHPLVKIESGAGEFPAYGSGAHNGTARTDDDSEHRFIWQRFITI